ncbi:MAG: hypothetical protein MUE81_21410 [Thermoflexibacter sp.]|jgi:hypothetical protein|nr:hypothetical protein [Thermoflexibacter sp.]
MEYFRLLEDMHYPNMWYLGDIINDDNNWKYSTPENDINSSDELEIEVYQDGVEKDFSLAGYAGVPVVSEKIKESLIEFDEIQFIPVKIVGKNVYCDYFILYTKYEIECVDEDKSEYKKFQVNDIVRPDKVGQFRAFFKLVIDTEKIDDVDIFRLRRCNVVIIVSKKIKDVFEKLNLTGATFLKV